MEMEKQQNLAKTSNIMAHAGSINKTSENNEIVNKLASCLIRSRILISAREQIQNKLARMIDYTFENLESLPLTLKTKGKWGTK